MARRRAAKPQQLAKLRRFGSDPGRVIRDPNTEAYAAAFLDTKSMLDQAFSAELRGLIEDAGAAYGLERGRRAHTLEAADGYALLTDLLFRIEDRISRIMAEHTADTLVLAMRRHVVLDVAHEPDDVTIARWMHIQHPFMRAAQLYAKPGADSLPTAGGTHSLPVTGDLVAGIDLATRLCLLYSVLQTERALLSTDDAWLELEGVGVPRAVTANGDEAAVLGASDDTVTSNLLARVGGLAIPQARPTSAGIDDLDPTSLVVCTWLPLRATRITDAEAASDVRLFRAEQFDAVALLEFLEHLDDQLVEQWGVDALELVASLTAISQLPQRVAATDPDQQFIRRYTTESRGAFTWVKEPFMELLGAVIPSLARSLDSEAPALDGDDVVSRVWSTLTGVPDTATSSPRRPTLDAGTPCVLDMGDDVLVDQQGLGAGLNTLLDVTSFAGSTSKGPWFEQATRSWLLHRVAGADHLPEMETELIRGQRVVAEADVVVRIDDTAFIVECKSRRTRRLGACVTREEARSQRRPYIKWAQQARRTAVEFAQSPSGRGPQVPDGVDWLVPVVCTPHLELLPATSEAMLAPGRPMVMTPGQAAEFLVGRSWSGVASPIERYPIERSSA